MDKKLSLADEIEKRLTLGETKEKIFSELSPKVDDIESLGWSLSHTPYPVLRSKYKVHSLFLAGLVILIPLQFFLALVQVRPNQLGLQLFGFFCLAFGFGKLAINVLTFKPAAPFLVSCWGGGLSVGLIFIATRKGHMSPALALQIGTTIAMFVLGLWLSRQLAPRGALLNSKAPRNKEGNIEFD